MHEGEQKGARNDPKGAKWESKVSRIPYKTNIKDKVAKMVGFFMIPGILLGVPRVSATIHFESHFHEKNDAKIDA